MVATSEMIETASPAEVAVTYDQMYLLFDVIFGKDIHFGYYGDGQAETPLHEAKTRLTDVVLDQLGDEVTNVLDLGCGWAALPFAAPRPRAVKQLESQ